jgi:hypothetical protein
MAKEKEIKETVKAPEPAPKAAEASGKVVIHNQGQRSFIVEGGILAQGKELKVLAETADKLIKLYPSEIRIIK